MTALVFSDSELAAKGLLKSLTPSGDATVGLSLPDAWDRETSLPHLLVGQDGSIPTAARLVEFPLIRVTAFANTTSLAKRLAREAEARLCAHRGGSGISKIKPATGMFPSRDPNTAADLASFTVRLTVRSTPLT